MTADIRALQGEEMLAAQYELGQYSFHSSPPLQDREEWLEMARQRRGVICYAALEEGRPVSTAASTGMTQNVRGKLYSASAVWGVATHPAARRKGYVRQVMASLLAAEREAGKVFTNLYPFRESFYERLGYVTYPLTKIARFSPHALAPLLRLDLAGEIELKLIGEAYETYRQFLAAMRAGRHGMGVFDHGSQALASRNRSWAALARFDGQIEGLMLYALQGEHVTRFTLAASRFVYLTARARYLLLGWIARHIDQAETAELRLPADETPETWLSDLQVKVESASRAAMGRVLDVAEVGGMQAGAGAPGGFAARVIDPLCPWNQGAWRFEAEAGALAVSRAAAGECDLTIQGLSALLAGTHDPQDFALRGWGNPGPETQAAMRSLFPRLCPDLYEVF